MQVGIVTGAATLRKRVSKPSFYRGMPISEDLAIVQCRVQTLTLNRPTYVGLTMLEVSKRYMYDFHYMKAKYPHAGQLKLLFTDTDSLAYAVITDSIYDDMAVDAVNKYDFSEYPLDHPLYNTSNKKSIGGISRMS